MANLDSVLSQILAAFADAPRPPDEELLHEACFDDNDLRSLYGIPHWREVPDAILAYEWSALAFLSPSGFRHFLPAYMSYALRHPDSGAAAIGSTIFALTPAAGDLQAFMSSKFTLFNAAQRTAVAAFLEALLPFRNLYAEDVMAALAYWRPSGTL